MYGVTVGVAITQNNLRATTGSSLNDRRRRAGRKTLQRVKRFVFIVILLTFIFLTRCVSTDANQIQTVTFILVTAFV